MSDSPSRSMVRWWATVMAAAAVALLFAWLGRLAGVPLVTLLSIGAAAAALAWLIVLVTVPWKLYFAARQVLAEMAASRERGITVKQAQDAEAGRIARRMLWFALGGHLITAAATVLVTRLSGAAIGYYLAGCYLLSMAVRPAAAYFAHLRQRIKTLSRESKHPRDDVVALKLTVAGIAKSVDGL